MRTALIRLSDGLDRLCRFGAAGGLVAMLVFVAIQVVARYVFRAPPIWTEELARFAMVWAGMLGATVAFKAGFDPVLVRLPDRGIAALRRLYRLIVTLAVITFMAPVLWYSLFGANLSMARGFLGRSAVRTADTLGFPMVWIALAVPVAAAVILIHLAARAAGDTPEDRTAS